MATHLDDRAGAKRIDSRRPVDQVLGGSDEATLSPPQRQAMGCIGNQQAIVGSPTEHRKISFSSSTGVTADILDGIGIEMTEQIDGAVPGGGVVQG